MGQIHGEETDLTGGKRVCVPSTRQKFHRPNYKEILDDYDDFRTYVIVVSLKTNTNIRHLDVQHRMVLKANKVE